MQFKANWGFTYVVIVGFDEQRSPHIIENNKDESSIGAVKVN